MPMRTTFYGILMTKRKLNSLNIEWNPYVELLNKESQDVLEELLVLDDREDFKYIGE